MVADRQSGVGSDTGLSGPSQRPDFEKAVIFLDQQKNAGRMTVLGHQNSRVHESFSEKETLLMKSGLIHH